jgi:methyltransferase (TIGR00027 family)
MAEMTPVGATSRWIAAARALETECQTPLFSDPYGRELAGDDGFALLAEMRRAAGPTGAPDVPNGPVLYLSLRTRFLDDALMAAMRDQGISQVVILAAGMDTRAFRLPWPQDVVIYELDRHDVFDLKEPVLAQRGATTSCTRHVIRIDLAQEDWVPRLLAAGFDRARPAAFLAEGLLMYLTPEDADRVIASVTSIAADGSWIGMDVVNRDMLESPLTAAYMKRLADLGVPWLFSMPDPEVYFARQGWHATAVSPGDPDASFGRWPFPVLPRAVPGIPRTYFVVATKGRASRLPGPISTATAEHYAWGQGCDGWHLVRQESLSVIQEEMPAGTTESRHRHARSRQFFHVLSGTLTIEVEGTSHTLPPGSGLEVPPAAAHTAANRGTGPVRFLLVSQPPAHGDREPA